MLIGLPLIVGLWLPRGVRGRAYGVLAAPLLVGLLVIDVTVVAADWDTAGPRYLYPALPAFAVFAALAVGSRWRRPAMLPWAAGVMTAGVAGIWLYMATTTPFTP